MARDSAPRSKSSWWFLGAFVAGVVVLFIGISFAQEIRRRVELQQHVQKLQGEIHEREQRIASLKELTEYLRTDAYQERAAREKLNYQRPNERVIVIPDSGAVLSAERENDAEPATRPVPIPQQWWELLFGPISS